MPIPIPLFVSAGILYNKRTIDKEFPDGLFEKVGKGLPVAQTYGLGAPWTDGTVALCYASYAMLLPRADSACSCCQTTIRSSTGGRSAEKARRV